MDKKIIINDLYQVAIISILAIGCSMLGKKITKITPPSVQKFDLEDMGKLVAIVAASEMMGGPSSNEKSYWNTSKMASITMLVGGGLANALALTGSSYLFWRLSKDDITREWKKHDSAIEQLQKVQVEWTWKWQEKIDFIKKQLRLERKAKANFEKLNNAIREYH